MEFTVSVNRLVEELAFAKQCAERKTTVPVLGMVKLQAKGEFLGVTATDLEIGVRSAIPANVKKDGQILLPVKRLSDLVSVLPINEEITFSTGPGGRIKTKCGRNRSSIPVFEGGEMPELPAVGKVQATVSAKALADLFSKVVFAISSEETRFTLNGALLEVTDAGVTVVATDGHRICIAQHLCDRESITSPVRTIVPRKTMNEFVKLAGKSEEGAMVSISVQDSNHQYFAIGSRLLYSRVITGTFPDYGKLLKSDEGRSKLLVPGASLKDAITRVSKFADERSKAVNMSFGEGGVCIVASTSESGDGEETLDATYSGPPVSLGLNSGYVNDFLNAIGANPIEVIVTDPGTPVEFRGEGDLTYRCIISPMRM